MMNYNLMMEKTQKCQQHNYPIEIICPDCKDLMCYRCLGLHKGKGCGGQPVDIPYYTKEKVIPKYRTILDDLEEKKFSIEIAINEFIFFLSKTRKDLIKFKDILENLLKTINNAIRILPVEEWPMSSRHNIKKLALINEYRELKEAISKDNIEYLLNKKDKAFDDVIGIGDNERQMINTTSKLLENLIEIKEFEVLNNSLQELNKTYQEIEKLYVPKINNRYIYGNCNPASGYKKLYKFDIQTKKLIDSISTAGGTTTQIGSRIYISGGSDPFINALSEFLENTQSLSPRATMKYAKCYHSTEAISPVEFITIGGRNGNSRLAYCEEYSIKDDKWIVIPSLNIPRSSTATTLIGNRYVYAIGGNNTKGEIEVLDLVELNNWVIVDIMVNGLVGDCSPAAFPISTNEIMILRGYDSTDVGVYDVKSSTIAKHEIPLKEDLYHTNPISSIGNNVYIIGDYRGHIHIYNMTEKKFTDIPFSEAKSK